METLRLITYDLKQMLDGKVLSDDSELSARTLHYWIRTQRALLIRNELNKNRTIDPEIIQDLGCVEVEIADRAECCAITADCSILRTVNQIPSPIELHHKIAITRVAPIDKLIPPFSFVPYQQAIYSGNGRFTKNSWFAFYKNGYIYIKTNQNSLLTQGIKYINIQGVFENPEDAATFTTCSGLPCYTSETPYPIKGWMIDYMKTQIVNSNIKILQTIPADKTNDADNTNTNTTAK
jgi:hypothetical protein